MDVDVQPPRSASPLSPTSSTGGADLSRRPSRKRSASPSSYERYGSSSPSRESVSSAGGRPSFDSRAGRTPTDSRPVRTSLDSRSPPVDSRRSTRLSIDSARPAPADEERTRSKSSLSHLLDGDGQGGMRHAVPISDTRHAIPLSDVRPPSDARLASDARHPILPPDVRHVGPPPSSSAGTSSRPNSKRGSISTAMAGMQLKSAATSRASSPGSTRTRSPGTIQAHAWPTFGAVGETMATGPAFNGPGGPAFNPTGERAPAFNMANERSDVWRNETEADMRRREVEAEERKRARLRLVDVEMEGVVREEGRVGEVDRHSDVDSRRHADLDQRRLGDLDSRRHADSDARRYVDPETRLRQGEVDLHRRRSEGAKRRRIGSEEEMAVEPDVSIVEQIRRASGEDVMARRTSEDPSKRASGESVARQMSNGDGIIRRGTGDRRTTGDDIIPKRVVRDDPIPRRTTTDESVQRRESSDNSISALRRGSIPMPGGWIAEERESAIVVSDSPELQSNDRMILEADEPKDSLISGPVEVSSKGGDGLGKNGVGNRDGAREGPSKNGVGEAPKVEPVSKKDGVVESIKAKRSPSTEGRNGSTPPVSTPFSHIWPPPSMSNLETKKGGRKAKTEPEPAPSRSFITQRNLSIAPAAPPAEEDTKDKDSGGSSLRSMLTTMPPRAVFMTAVQTFLAQPKRKGRTVVMTKALMKDALGVLLDPTTEELLKDYVQPEQPNPNKDEDKSSRDGTPRSSRIDASDHTTLEFRAWTKRMFSTVKTGRGEEVVLAFGGKPVVVEDDIYETIVLSHSKGNHCSTEETVRLVDQAHSWVPRLLVEAFVQECPGCPASNKVASTVAKPKKRKWVRKDDKPAGGAATTKRKPAARRGKKGQGQQEGGKRRKGKEEASPADESDGEVEEEQEQEQELEGEQEQEQEPEPEMEEDELGEDGAEEEEMESEDEHVSARPVAIVASSVPVGDSKMEVD
ncbi:hypothetical protein FRC09_000302 [Ceratobasidium sp. 395]|nr:hypothetical protein FRC09_000302 [Ceratobasidium sp. 395]